MPETNKKLKGTTLVTGLPVQGKIVKDISKVTKAHVFVTKELSVADYKAIMGCQAVICEYGGRTSHMTVMCRIRGIPVIQIENAMDYFKTRQQVTIDFVNEHVYNAQIEPPPEAFNIPKHCWPDTLRYQISIVEPSDIQRANSTEKEDIETFFLRSEFAWVLECQEPFQFLKDNNLDVTVGFLINTYKAYAAMLLPGQFLNIRSLDMRSDEFDVFDASPKLKEPNPQLGCHGIRQLLNSPQFLVAELLAIDSLYDLGFDNIVFSLPFVISEDEVEKVQQLMSLCCKHNIKLGVFVETPAAVSDLSHILKHGVQFIYIGTKDLTQLVLGVDRGNKAVSHLYDTRKRSVLNYIQKSLDICHAHHVPASIFSLAEDINYYTQHLRYASSISLCCSDYLQGASPTN